MLTKLILRNFKRFDEVEIELGNPVVFIGPNNSGKTSAMQALALWDTGVKRWNEKRKGKSGPEKRPGVTINRRDLIALPVPESNLLWRELHVRDVRRIHGKPQTSNIRIDIIVEGVTEGRPWTCGLEFDYANDESFYCRPLRLSSEKNPERMTVPHETQLIQISFLPPMSGLAATETRLDQGAVNVRIGEGRTAEVLRNLCYRIHEERPDSWEKTGAYIRKLFGADLDAPRYVTERGEILMTYREQGVRLDLSSSGRGLQQTLLLIAYMFANPGAILLLDEPDAHLEFLRQRQTYDLINDVARENGNQIIAASHSEVLLNEAAGRDLVVAFIGRPHRVDDRHSQVLKSLKEYGFEQYFQAEQTCWVLYLEGSTDLAVLQAFARRLGHEDAAQALEQPFVHYVADQPSAVSRHFYALKEAVPDLKGIALFDRLDANPDIGSIGLLMWKKREIENYLCTKSTLLEYARSSGTEKPPGPLFAAAEADQRVKSMKMAITEIETAMQRLGRGSPWDDDTKVSDDFLVPLFSSYFEKLGVPNLMAKKNFYELAEYVPEDDIDEEIREKLDAIAGVFKAVLPPR